MAIQHEQVVSDGLPADVLEAESLARELEAPRYGGPVDRFPGRVQQGADSAVGRVVVVHLALQGVVPASVGFVDDGAHDE